jgi:hypothetical protein
MASGPADPRSATCAAHRKRGRGPGLFQRDDTAVHDGAFGTNRSG